MAVDREQLEAWVEDFTEAFNRENIDAVMAYFADDAIYDEFHGGRHVGKAAIAPRSSLSSRASTAGCASTPRTCSSMSRPGRR